MSNEERHSLLSHICVCGTPECGVCGAVLGLVVGLLLVFTGFWTTLFIVLLMAIGAFLGGVKDKKQWFKNLVNRLIPERNTVAYPDAHPDIVRAVREATEKPAPSSEKAEDAQPDRQDEQ